MRDARGDDWMVYHAVDSLRPRAAPTAEVNTRRVLLMDRITYRDRWPQVEGGGPSAAARGVPPVR